MLNRISILKVKAGLRNSMKQVNTLISWRYISRGDWHLDTPGRLNATVNVKTFPLKDSTEAADVKMDFSTNQRAKPTSSIRQQLEQSSSGHGLTRELQIKTEFRTYSEAELRQLNLDS
jgi:hypothetical protein